MFMVVVALLTYGVVLGEADGVHDKTVLVALNLPNVCRLFGCQETMQDTAKETCPS